jgi:SprT protein
MTLLMASRANHQLADWCAQWGLPGFERALTVTFSRRFRSALGRCAPASREIRLAAFLLDGPAVLLAEVLCHEAAHAAAYEIHGARVKPHGPEWKRLMEQVGFAPRVKFPAALLPGGLGTEPRRRSGAYWVHQCPVCHARRVAKAHVGRWRCASCVQDGLDGHLVVTRFSAGQRFKAIDE